VIVVVGFVIVMGSVITGFTLAGGHLGSLIHPTEFVTIGGAALGALIVMSPATVLKDLGRGILQAVKGSPYGRKAYEELFKALYELFTLARRDGLLALDAHVSNPRESTVLTKYPTICHHTHNLTFLCSALGLLLDGSLDSKMVRQFLDAELKSIEVDHHQPVGVLAKTADSLPGFGIVAAVLGIVVTMEAIDGPVDEIGHKVGAALVGTFLGILLSYGICAPLAVKIESLGALELMYFRTIATSVHGFSEKLSPKATLELSRRGLGSEVRITSDELTSLFTDHSTKAS
jgi:chemotaxis protein MotA